MFLVDGAHERSGRREDLVDKDEDGLLWRQLDALADHVDELHARGGVPSARRLLPADIEDCWRTCPTVRSAGTRYFFLSIAGISVLSAFSQMTCANTHPNRVSCSARHSTPPSNAHAYARAVART